MPVLTDTALVPGEPAGRTKVTVAIAGTSDPVYTDDGTIVAPRTEYTADDGTFTLTLPGNDDLIPTGTAYTVTFDGTISATIEMPSGGGPYSLADILTTAPASVLPAGAAPAPLLGYTALELASDNPVLAAGRLGVAVDSEVIKLGDGTTAWNDLVPRMPALPETIIARGTPTASGITATVVDIAGTTIGPFEATDTVHWKVELRTPFVFPVGANSTFANPRTSITDAANNPTAFGFGQTGFVNTLNQPAQCSVLPAFELIETPGTYTRKARIERMFGVATLGQGLTGFVSLDSILIATPFTP